MFKGSKYTRVDVGWICLPETGRPTWRLGCWICKVEDKLIIFMNIGVPGKTGHDFDNYDLKPENSLVWKT